MSDNKKPADLMAPLLPRTDLATGEVLAPEIVKGLVQYAMMYRLDAYRGHVVLMYGKPYITIDGYLYHAHRQNKTFDLASRPLTDEERKTYRVESDKDHAWLAEIHCPGVGYVTGIGVVTEEELTTESKNKPGQLRWPVVAAHPWQMAQKRAEWQALRRAFPIGESQEEKSASGD